MRTSALALLFEQMGVALVAVVVNSSLFTYLSWDIVDRRLLIGWLFASYAIVVVRYIAVQKWQKAVKYEEHEVNRMFRLLYAGIFLSACLLGAMGVFGFTPEHPIHLMTTVFILAGMSGGAVAAYSVHAPAVYLAIYPILLPLIARLLLEPNPEYRVMAMMAGIYLVLMSRIGRNVSKRTQAAVESSFEHQDLVARLNDASHEIRTPVSAISGAADLLAGHPRLPGELINLSEIIYRHSTYLRKLVDNVLLLGKSESKAPQVQREVIALRDEIELASSFVKKEMDRKGLEYRLRIAEDVPEHVHVDSLRLQQIMVNLLANAVKFTNEGFIAMEVRFEVPDRLIFKIEDSGIGINPDAQAKIFQPFFRETRGEVKFREGSGLGLTLSRSLARNLGGDLRIVRSEVGKGSTFEFMILVTPMTVEKKIEINPAALAGKRIVLVDDAEDIRFLYRQHLESVGAHVEVCRDGEQALQLLQYDKDYDLVLMDLNMPEMDGFAATKTLRERGFSRPIVALSAYSSADTKEKCKTVGFDGHLSKSLPVPEFLDSVQKIRPHEEDSRRG